MQLLRLILVRHTFLSLLGCLALSEALVLHWGLVAFGGGGLGPVALALWTLGLAVANLAALTALRSLRRSTPIYHAGRWFMVGSLGALATGPPLVAVLVASLATSWGVEPGAGKALAAGGGALAVALGFGSILWGCSIGQRRLRVDEVDLPVRDLPPALAGLRIAHISDLHIGRQLRAPRLRALLERVNELEPDLIAITGDIFDFDPEYIEEGCHELAKLTARYGVFAILGNHDIYTGADAVAGGIRQLTPIRLLRDEWTCVVVDAAPLYVAGVDDPGRGWTERDGELPALERLARELPDDGPSLLLAHRPAFFGHAARLRFGAVLSGHTHGGQISLPPPAHHHNISRLISRWTRGRFELGDSVLYVNRGLGVVGPPVRLNCPREISLLRLVPRA